MNECTICLGTGRSSDTPFVGLGHLLLIINYRAAVGDPLPPCECEHETKEHEGLRA